MKLNRFRPASDTDLRSPTESRDDLRAPAQFEQPRVEKKTIKGQKRRAKTVGGVVGLVALSLTVAAAWMVPHAPHQKAPINHPIGVVWGGDDEHHLDSNLSHAQISLHYTLTNTTNQTINLADLWAPSDPAIRVPYSSCRGLLAPGMLCDLDVDIMPPHGSWTLSITNPSLPMNPLTLDGYYSSDADHISFGPLASGALDSAVLPGPEADVTVRNVMPHAVYTGGIHINGPTPKSPSPFEIYKNTCPTQLAAGNSCIVTIRLASLDTPSASGQLVVGGDHLALSARALRGRLVLSSHPDGQTVVVQVKNTGTGNASLASVRLTGAGFHLDTDDCSTILPPTGFCTVTIETPLQGNGTLLVDNQSIAVNGYGPILDWQLRGTMDVQAPTQIPQDSTAAMAILHNTGRSAFSVTAPTTTGPFKIRSNSCKTPLSTDDTCRIGIVAQASKNGILTGSLNMPGAQPLELRATAVGFDKSLAFSGPPAWTDHGDYTMTNTGSLPIANPRGDIVLHATPEGMTLDDNCDKPLLPKASCQIHLTRPQTIGVYRGVLTANTSSVVLASFVSRIGPAQPVITPSTVTLVLPNSPHGDSSADLDLNNAGLSDLDTAPTLIGTAFSLGDSDCPQLLAPDAHCRIVVHGHAYNSGIFLGQLSVGKAVANLTLTAKLFPIPVVQAEFVHIGSSGTATANIFLSNQGGAPYSLPALSDWVWSGPATVLGRVTTSDCKTVALAPGSRCSVQMSITSDQVGRFSAAMTGPGIGQVLIHGVTEGIAALPVWIRVEPAHGVGTIVRAILANTGKAVLMVPSPIATSSFVPTPQQGCQDRLDPKSTCTMTWVQRKAFTGFQSLVLPGLPPVALQSIELPTANSKGNGAAETRISH